MGRLLAPASLLLVLVASGCAPDDSVSPAPEGSSSSTSSSSSTDEATPSPGGPVDVQVVEMVSTSQGGGEVDPRPLELAPEDHLADLVAGLEAGLPDRVRRAVADAERDPEVRDALAEGRLLMGSVVWVGCETPRDVIVTGSGARLEVAAVVPGKGTVQCLVPVTTVAVFLV